MTYLLDTNAWIGWLRGNQPKLIARIKATPPSDLKLCSPVLGELRYGVERSDPAYRPAHEARLVALRAKCASLPYDDASAEEYGRIRAHLAARGTMIGPNDLMIAAIALANGLTVVTHNTAEFGRVPGLIVEDWQ
jgi:tRNA(fMet)-specific endonuclease VapC